MDKVVFRKYPDGEVIALFPETPADMSPYNCYSYLHIGQGGAANPHLVISQTKLAQPHEYHALQKELEGRGDVLEVRKRVTRLMHTTRFYNHREMLYHPCTLADEVKEVVGV